MQVSPELEEEVRIALLNVHNGYGWIGKALQKAIDAGYSYEVLVTWISPVLPVLVAKHAELDELRLNAATEAIEEETRDLLLRTAILADDFPHHEYDYQIVCLPFGSTSIRDLRKKTAIRELTVHREECKQYTEWCRLYIEAISTIHSFLKK